METLIAYYFPGRKIPTSDDEYARLIADIEFLEKRQFELYSAAVEVGVLKALSKAFKK